MISLITALVMTILVTDVLLFPEKNQNIIFLITSTYSDIQCTTNYKVITFGKLDRCNGMLEEAPAGSLENVESSLSYE